MCCVITTQELTLQAVRVRGLVETALVHSEDKGRSKKTSTLKPAALKRMIKISRHVRQPRVDRVRDR